MNCRYLIDITWVFASLPQLSTTISSTCILLCTAVDGMCNSYISTLYRGVHLVCTNQAEKGLLRAVVHFPGIWFGPCTADQRAIKRIPSAKHVNTLKYRLIGRVEYQHVIICSRPRKEVEIHVMIRFRMLFLGNHLLLSFFSRTIKSLSHQLHQ